MGRIQLVIPDDLEEKFRKEVFKRHGMKKGNISIALTKAIEQWLNEK